MEQLSFLTKFEPNLRELRKFHIKYFVSIAILSFFTVLMVDEYIEINMQNYATNYFAIIFSV
jgi:hypothetical protein